MSIVYSLYELSQQYQEFLSLVEAGEIPQEAIQDTLASLSGEMEEKVDSIACMIKQLQLEAEGIKQEENALSMRRKQKETAAERLKDYIRQTMTLSGKKKLETARSCVSVGKPAQRVEITDISAIQSVKELWKPYEWTEKNVDKAKLKDALKAGTVKGARLVDGSPRLTIK